jgi:hypothetical protein
MSIVTVCEELCAARDAALRALLRSLMSMASAGAFRSADAALIAEMSVPVSCLESLAMVAADSKAAWMEAMSELGGRAPEGVGTVAVGAKQGEREGAECWVGACA